MKLVRMLILALGLMTIVTASSFAAVPFFTTSTVNIMAVNAQTALAGSILFTPLSSGTISTGEIINIAYQAPISYLRELVVTVQNTTFTGFTAYGTTSGPDSNGVSVTVNQTNIVISFGANLFFDANNSAHIIKVDRVRLDVTSIATIPGTTSVFMSNTTGQATVVNPQLIVGTFSEPLVFGTPAYLTATNGSVNFFSNGTINAGQNIATITLNEVFTNAFDTRAVAGENSQVRFTLSGLPTGLKVDTVTVAGTNGANVTGGNSVGAPLVITATINSQSPNALEGIQVGITFNVTSGTTALALNPSPITVTATLVPPGATKADGTPNYPFSNPPGGGGFGYVANQYKYAARNITSTLNMTVTPLVSRLLSVFNEAIRNAAIPGDFLYDTGIAIANTSGTGTITTGQPGVITVDLYPLDGSGPKSFTTGTDAATRPGLGLDSTGKLAAKQTWVVLLSQLLTPAGFSATADFRGFIRFTTNFQGAQGINYIADGDFAVQAQGYPMYSDQVVPNMFNSSY